MPLLVLIRIVASNLYGEECVEPFRIFILLFILVSVSCRVVLYLYTNKKISVYALFTVVLFGTINTICSESNMSDEDTISPNYSDGENDNRYLKVDPNIAFKDLRSNDLSIHYNSDYDKSDSSSSSSSNSISPYTSPSSSLDSTKYSDIVTEIAMNCKSHDEAVINKHLLAMSTNHTLLSNNLAKALGTTLSINEIINYMTDVNFIKCLVNDIKIHNHPNISEMPRPEHKVVNGEWTIKDTLCVRGSNENWDFLDQKLKDRGIETSNNDIAFKKMLDYNDEILKENQWLKNELSDFKKKLSDYKRELSYSKKDKNNCLIS